MAEPQTRIRVRHDDRTATILVEGRVTMHNTPAVRQFAEEWLAGVQSVGADELDLLHGRTG